MFSSSRVVPYYCWVYSVLCCLAWRPFCGKNYLLEMVNLTNNMTGCSHVLSFIKFCVVPCKTFCASHLVWLVCFTFVCGSHTSDHQHFLKNYLHMMFYSTLLIKLKWVQEYYCVTSSQVKVVIVKSHKCQHVC